MPIAFVVAAIALLFAPGALRLLTILPLALLGLFGYGVYRSCMTVIEFGGDGVTIDGERFARSHMRGFIGVRDAGSNGVDDEPGHCELWLDAADGRKPVALLSGAVDIDRLVVLLNSRSGLGA